MSSESPARIPPPPSEVDWRTYLAAVVRHKWLVLGITAAGTGAGVLAALFLAPTYQAEAAVWIESAPRSPRDPGPIWAAQLLGHSGWVELARSDVVLGHVVDDLRLFMHPRTPADAAALASLERTEDRLQPGAYRLELTNRAGRRYGLRDESGVLVDEAAFGEPLGTPLGFRWLPPDAGARGVRATRFEIVEPYDATRELVGRLRIRTDRDGSFLRIQLRGSDPTRLAAVVNAIAERFVNVAADLKRQRLTALVGILGGQLEVARRQLDEREQALKDFRSRSATLLTEGGTPAVAGVSVTRDPLFAAYLDSRVTHDQLRFDREAIERALEPGPDGAPGVQALELVGAVQRAPALTQALRDLTTKQADLRALRGRYTEAHPDVQRVAQEVAGLERRTIPALARELLVELRTREGLVGQRVESTASDLRRISPLAVQEARLQGDVTIAQQLFADLRTRYEEVRLSEVSTIPDVRVLDVARPPRRPLTHMAPVMVLLGLITGAGAGVGSAVVRQALDRKVRLPVEVTTHLGVRILGVVPHVSTKTHGAEPGPVVEALRVIRLNLLHAYGTAGPVLVTVTSAGGGEGKSFIACNLSLSFAGAGQRTLLIDADTRRGTLHRVLGAARRPGLIDHVAGHQPGDAIVQHTRYPGLHFVGCGMRSRAGPELLMGPELPRFLAGVRPNYDVIIVDSPPLSAGVDPYALATLTGNAMLVVRTGVTERQLAEAKLDVLRHLPVRMLGAVLNDARMTGAYQYLSYYMEGYELRDEEEARGTHAPRVLRS